MYDRVELKDQAKLTLRRNYGKCVVAGLLLIVLGGEAGSSTVTSSWLGERSSEIAWWLGQDRVLTILLSLIVVGMMLLLQMLICNPLMVGICRFSVINAHRPAVLDELGCGFGANYKSSVKTMFRMYLYVFLWSLLLFIPGIVAGYHYRMVPYLLAEHPELDTREVLQRSKELMMGHKLDAFVLDLSFVGWYLLSAVTFGLVGVFFVAPYKMQTDANLYVVLSGGNLYAEQ